jgi:pyruvate dehydrogenase E2 component (dihydrolipoamide acetyltransferase)
MSPSYRPLLISSCSKEYQGGAFSVSNLGMYGISMFSAVINPPQACILAVGAGIERVVPSSDAKSKYKAVTMMTVQLSADRRVVSEAVASQFLQVFREYLSDPKKLLL